MKTIIFIDGENFVYQLRDMLAKRRLVKYRDELVRVDIRKMLADVIQNDSVKTAKIEYYAAKVHIIDRTPELKERTERYAKDADAWEKALISQNINYVQAGHLLVRDGKPCQVCGHAEPVLVEKGVDLRFATDVIRASGENVRIILLSSDGDMVPAIEESKRRGAELWYVGFRGVSNAALARTATRKFTILAKHAAAALGPKPQKYESQDRDKKPEHAQYQRHKTGDQQPSGAVTGSRLASMLLPQSTTSKVQAKEAPERVTRSRAVRRSRMPKKES
ncbi:NYN domain-containing protein [bacterium]|nr:NYN domain-containing protein [bacterium]